MTRRPAAVIFDVEGTLIDCVPLVLESWRQTLDEAGHPFTIQDLHPYSGMDGSWMLERLLPKESEDVRQQLLEKQGERYRTAFLPLARPFTGVHELIEELKGRGVAVGLATTCKTDELVAYDEHVQIRQLVDAIVCGESVQHGKPDPALLRDCLSMLGIDHDPSTAIAIGDTPYDAIAARKAATRCAGVLTGGFSQQALLAAGCEHVADRVTAIGRLWRSEPGQHGTPIEARARPQRRFAATKSDLP
jgi:phosphoglycolate phosphatase-like HAD superfamily hydrolase